MSSTREKNNNDADWINIGEHENRAVLRKAIRRIRAKWLDRYELRICPKDAADDDNFQLQLKHS